MTPKITDEQREALKRDFGPVRVEDDQSNDVYYLVDEASMEEMRKAADLAAIREGIADMKAGRVYSLEEVDARLRERLRAMRDK